MRSGTGFTLLIRFAVSPVAGSSQNVGEVPPFVAQRQSYRIAVVTPGAPAKLYVDWKPGCPAIASDCFDSSTLKAGTLVVLRTRDGALAQVNSRDISQRFVPLDRIRILPVVGDPPLSAWHGLWRNSKDALKITPAQDGGLDVHADAFWFGNEGVVHSGGIKASAKPQGNTVDLVEGDGDACRVDLTLLGDLLYAEDNGLCGGMNVRINGFYRHSTSAVKREPQH